MINEEEEITKEDIFKKNAFRTSEVFDIKKFKKYQPQLFKAIMKSMDDYVKTMLDD